jgi:predicted aminopeptidase
MRPCVGLAIVLFLLTATGCGGFYFQAVSGHLDLMSERRPIDEVLADPSTPPELAYRLRLIAEAREFAVGELALPENDSYRTYVDLDRPYVVWNVFAAPEFSVEPRRWCFPVAGCVVYRGYFDEDRGRRYAARLRRQGWDVHVGGAIAYSTLGRFDDPVLSTMLRGGDVAVVATIFHELAHQQLYVKGDSAFNEAFASTVEDIGVERWLSGKGELDALAQYREHRSRRSAFNFLLKQTREELAAIYGRGAPEEAMRAEKQQSFETLRQRYRALKASWDGYAGFDAWFDSELNNARLVPVSTYARLVPAFRELYRRAAGDLRIFYDECAALGALPAEERTMRIEALLAISEDPDRSAAVPGPLIPGGTKVSAQPVLQAGGSDAETAKPRSATLADAVDGQAVKIIQ